MATNIQDQVSSCTPSSDNSYFHSSPGTDVPVWDLKVGKGAECSHDGYSPASSRFNETWPSGSDEGETAHSSTIEGQGLVPEGGGHGTHMDRALTGADETDRGEVREGSILMKYIERFRRAPPTHRGSRESPNQQFWWKEARREHVTAGKEVESRLQMPDTSQDKKLLYSVLSPKSSSDTDSNLLSRSQDILDRSSVFLVSPLESPPAQKFWNSQRNLGGLAQPGHFGASHLTDGMGNSQKDKEAGNFQETALDYGVISPSEDILMQWRLRRRLEQARRESAQLGQDHDRRAGDMCSFDRHPLGYSRQEAVKNGSRVCDSFKDVTAAKTKPEELPSVSVGVSRTVTDSGVTRASGSEADAQTYLAGREVEVQTSPSLLAGGILDIDRMEEPCKDISSMKGGLISPSDLEAVQLPGDRRNTSEPSHLTRVMDCRMNVEGQTRTEFTPQPLSPRSSQLHPQVTQLHEGSNDIENTDVSSPQLDLPRESFIGHTLLGKLTETSNGLCGEERRNFSVEVTDNNGSSTEASVPPAHGGLALRHEHFDGDDEEVNELLTLSLTADITDMSSCAVSSIEHCEAPPSSTPLRPSAVAAKYSPAPPSSMPPVPPSIPTLGRNNQKINSHSHSISSSTPSRCSSQQAVPSLHGQATPPSCPTPSSSPPQSCPEIVPPSFAGNSSKNGEYPPQKRSTLEAVGDPLTWYCDMEDDLLKLLITKAQFFEAQIRDIDQLLMAIELEEGVQAT